MLAKHPKPRCIRSVNETFNIFEIEAREWLFELIFSDFIQIIVKNVFIFNAYCCMILCQFLLLMKLWLVKTWHATLCEHFASNIWPTFRLLFYNMMYNFFILVFFNFWLFILITWIWWLLLWNIILIINFASWFLEHDDDFIVILNLNVPVKLRESLHTLVKRVIQFSDYHLIFFEKTHYSIYLMKVFH